MVNIALDKVPIKVSKRKELRVLWPDLVSNLDNVISLVGNELKQHVTFGHGIHQAMPLDETKVLAAIKESTAIMGEGIFATVDQDTFDFLVPENNPDVIISNWKAIHPLKIASYLSSQELSTTYEGAAHFFFDGRIVYGTASKWYISEK